MVTKRVATKAERAVMEDEAKMRSITTGEVLRERGLCPAVLVRTREAGVHIGYLADYSHRDGSPLGVVELIDGRQLWSWSSDGAEPVRELHGIAERGAPRAKISEACSMPYTVAGVCSVMALTPDAEANLMRTRWES